MCYSAQIVADYREYLRLFGATMSLREFVDVFWHRRTDGGIKLPKAVEDAFAEPRTDDERKIKGLIDEYRAQEATAGKPAS
jgi:hypothetical protein